MGNEINTMSASVLAHSEAIEGIKKDVGTINEVLETQEKDMAQFDKLVYNSDVRIKILEGKVKHQEIVMADMQQQLTNVTARQMSRNIVFTQVGEGEDESELDTRAKVTEFMKEKMSMTDNDIGKIKFDATYRVGRKKGPHPRRIIARLSNDSDPKDLFRFRRNINFKENQMFQQYPAEVNEKRTLLQTVADTEFADTPIANKRIAGDKLFVQGKEYVPTMLSKNCSPAAYDEHKVDWSKQSPKVVYTDVVFDKGNRFKAYSAKISSLKEAQAVKDMVMAEQRTDPATHITYAYRLPATSHPSELIRYLDDDREHGAGRRLLGTLDKANLTGVIVLVARWFSGYELGPARFKHYENVAHGAIHKLLHG